MTELFDLHFRDESGYTLLGNAVRYKLLDVVKFLVTEHKFKVKEELTVAVEVDFKECVDFLIQHQPELVGRKVLAGTVCRPGMSPVMMAALMENESMLKFLFARGAKPLELPEYDPSDMNNIIRFDAIYQTFVAVSKPMYLCIMNEDPVMVAFKELFLFLNIAEKCEEIAGLLDVAKDDLLQIKSNCEQFAANFINYVETFDEMEILLSQMTTEDVQLVVPGYLFERLKYAMKHNHVDYVANSSVQKLLKKNFYSGPLSLGNFESASLLKRMLYISSLVFLTPVWLGLYLFFPSSETPNGKFVKGWMEMPFMRFVVHSVLYLFVCSMVLISSYETEIFFLQEYADISSKRNCLERIQRLDDFRCLDDYPDFSPEQKLAFRDQELFSIYLFATGFQIATQAYTNSTLYVTSDAVTLVWTFGNMYKEALLVWSEGFTEYASDWVNLLNIPLNICFLSALSLTNSFSVVRGYKPLEIYGDDVYHPLRVSSALRSIGLLLLYYKLYKFLRLTQLVGRQQVLLADSFQVCLNFMLLFIVFSLSFSIAANGIIWRTYRAYIQNCQQLPNGTFNPVVEVAIPCSNNFDPHHITNLINNQDLLKLYERLFFVILDSKSYILGIFPSYVNPQEWTLAFMYSVYLLFTVFVRMIIMTSLVIFSVISCSRTEVKDFKFRRAVLMFQFIHGIDPLPSPFNIVPSIYRITAWSRARKAPKYKMLSEEELLSIPKMRNFIRSLKLNYLREERKENLTRGLLKAGTMKGLGSRFREKLITADAGVRSIHERTAALLEKTKGNKLNGRASTAGSEIDRFTEIFQKRKERLGIKDEFKTESKNKCRICKCIKGIKLKLGECCKEGR
ncbi:transient-receptor-potential-like protein [Convolutriloba macropyga]|uniref:transient-receptor-potential-like protein n=1 Tax=Convolutriloba macropyga TaxID=536237 RepID=UPI003F520F88